ncbi:O-antigen ligase family protein [Enterococcus faecium]|uniref:O-antigen ligase family protein n=1 Tax=Enterococcus TaxID=1350 RepID=UPI0019DDEF8B|nr:O-antigen ligase family protein [Enterococcus faecium]EGP4746882.1 hypothetical protein [Enterococcus faecium]MCO5531497.1 O-antigen ligase family protein [Enterococcus faecium]MDK4381264.1 O-antigen ligase family protein [Enterococcus faecium]MDV7748352.1 O-antigen ligase family protein [Enterococcus faecium]
MLRKISSEKLFGYLIIFFWGYHAFFRFFGILFRRIPVVGELVLPIIVAGLIIGSVPFIIKYIRMKDFLFFCIVLIVIMVTLFLEIKTTEPFNDIWMEFLTQCFIMYFVGLALYAKICKDDKMLNVLSILSILCILTLTIVYKSTSNGFEYEWSSTQYIPYSLLPHILLLCANIFEKISIIKLFVAIYGTFNLAMLGNRGSIVCLLVMILLLTIYKTSEMNKSKRTLLLLVITLLFVIVLFSNLYEGAMLKMYKYALEHNLSTRVFQTFLGEYNAGTSFDSGRLEIQRNLWQKLAVNPFGYGLGSDRYFEGQYAHSVILEILIDFGVFLGGMIIFVILKKIIEGLIIINRESSMRGIYLVMLSIGFVKLFISSSYLIDPYFYLLLGISVSLSRGRKSI